MAWGIHLENDCKRGKAQVAEHFCSTTIANQFTTNTANQAYASNITVYFALLNSLRSSSAFQSDSE